jgi:predicted PurR-regulated permease PerM
MYGATMPVILVSGILGGIIGAPIAHWIEDRRPEYIHGTVPNVLAMTISTVIVAAVISCISWL